MKKSLMMVIAGLLTAFTAIPVGATEILGMDIHGFVSQGYLSRGENDFTLDTEDDTIVFSEIGLNFGKEFGDNLQLGIQFFAKDFSEVSKNEIEIDWAYADYRFHELIGVRIGQIKFPHGLYNEVRDIDILHTPIFLPDSVYQEISYDLYANDPFLMLQGISSRDIYMSLRGVGLYGYIDLSAAGGITYQAMYGTQNMDPNDDISEGQMEYFKKLTPDIPLSRDGVENDKIEIDYKYAGNLVWDTPLDGLRIGASLNNLKMTIASMFTEDINYNIGGEDVPIMRKGDIITIEYEKLENWVFSAEYIRNNLILMAEYILTNKNYEISSDAFERIGSDEAATDNTSYGWYAGGTYRFTDWFELGGYYSQSRYDKAESNTEFSVYFFTEFDDICATARFDINENWTIKLEAHNYRSEYPSYESFSDLTDVKSTDVEDEWQMYAVKMTVAF